MNNSPNSGIPPLESLFEEREEHEEHEEHLEYEEYESYQHEEYEVCHTLERILLSSVVLATFPRSCYI